MSKEIKFGSIPDEEYGSYGVNITTVNGLPLRSPVGQKEMEALKEEFGDKIHFFSQTDLGKGPGWRDLQPPPELSRIMRPVRDFSEQFQFTIEEDVDTTKAREIIEETQHEQMREIYRRRGY